MSKAIIKLTDKQTNNDYYLIWSTIVDAPVSYGMSYDKCVKLFIKDFTDLELLHLSNYLTKLKETGSTANLSIEELLEFNKAGANGEKLSSDEIIQDYCLTHTASTKIK
mgnify:CR=1 FL=1